MAGFVQNMLWNSVSGFVDSAKKTGGEYAGNALIKAGDMIEGGGRSVGGSVEKAATGYGSKLSGQSYQPSSASKALPSTARKPAVKRSNSMPANTKPSGGVPLGAKKPVGGAKKAVGSVAGGATKTVGGVTGGVGRTAGGVVGGAGKTVGGVTGGATRGVNGVVGGASKTAGGVTGGATRGVNGVVGGAGKTVGGVTGGATRGVNGVVGGASKTAGGVVGSASKPVGGLVGGATKGLGGITGGATKATGGVVNNATRGVSGIAGSASKPLGGIVNGASKPVSSLGSAPQGLPKPYNSTAAASSYTNPYPSAKKAPVKPGMSKPFTPPAAGPVNNAKTPYPGTNTLPGQGGKTPVKRTYTPAPTLGSQVTPGQKMTHIGAF